MSEKLDVPIVSEALVDLANEGARASQDAVRIVSFVLRDPDSAGDFLKLLQERLEAVHQALVDGVSAIPDNAAFLKARGLERTDQLDEQGKRELTAHLKLVLAYFEARNEDKQRSGTE